MSNIKIGALGGLGEIGKNLYICEIDEQIFVLDCGIKIPTSEFYGIDTIIPDYFYLKENINKVKGVFLSHAHYDHVNGLTYMLKEINVPVYGSNFTIAVVEDNLLSEKMKKEDYCLNRVTDNDVIEYGNVKVSFFRLTHSVPEALGIAIHTENGSIVYTGDYSFDQNVNANYKTSFDKIAELDKEGVLCLLGEAYGSRRVSTDSYHELMYKLNSIFKDAPSRIIVSLFSNDLRRIQQVIDVSLKYNKDIAIIGRKTQRLVDVAINLGYINIPTEKLVNLRYIDDKNDNVNPNMVVIVSGERHEPYYMLQRMCKKLDRLINITNRDTIITMTTPTDGTEKMAAKTLDLLCRTNTRIHTIDKKILETSHATREEVKMMINMLHPKYIVPVKGEYRQQYAAIEIASEINFPTENVIILDNGYFIVFDNGINLGVKESFPAGEILIDGALAGDVNNVVLHDREQLAKDGIMLIIANLNPKTKKILSGPEIIVKGFTTIKESDELTNGIKEVFSKVAKTHLTGKYVNWNDLKKDIKEEVNRYLYKELQRTPITIPIVIATEEETK